MDQNSGFILDGVSITIYLKSIVGTIIIIVGKDVFVGKDVEFRIKNETVIRI